MIITWYGQACFKIQSSNLTIAIDPFDKKIGLTPPRFRADVVLITHAHADHSNSAAIGGEPFLIDGPGEYETRNASIRGIHTFHDEVKGTERGMNTAYAIQLEGITVLHMGDFGEKELREETLEHIGNVDIALVPVGGTYTVDGKGAARAIRQLEPSIAIPMHHAIPGLTAPLADAEMFLKEMSAQNATPQEKLTIKKKDLAIGKTEIVVLTPA